MSEPTTKGPATATRRARSARAKSISRTDVNFWLDATLLAVFLSLVWVATVVRFVFPPAASAHGWLLWSLSLDQWIALQYGLLCLLMLGILVHVMLHWSWVCGVIASRIYRAKDGTKRTMDDGTRTILGVGVMIVLLNILGLAMAAAVLSIQRPI